MNRMTIGVQSTVFVILVLGLLVIMLGFGLPSTAVAAEVSVQTAQLLPPGSNNACAQLAVSGFTPYIYNGALHGFEFSVADSSYVAIAGSAGSTSIPFNQMTRRIEPSGSLRVHADIDTTPIRGGLTVAVTMLSAKAGVQTVCISILSTTISSDGIAEVAPTPVVTSPPPSPTPTPASGTSGGGTKVTPPTPTPGTGTTTTATGIKSTKATSTGGITANILKDMCVAGGASRLWFVLLAIYAIVVAIAVFGQPQLPAAIRSQEWVAAAIVVPFLLLFGLWYFVESCRISAWVPAIATLIALVGLGAAFWDRSKSPQVINLPGSKT